MDQPITVYGHDSEVKFLTACEIWEVATNEAIDKFGNEWRKTKNHGLLTEQKF